MPDLRLVILAFGVMVAFARWPMLPAEPKEWKADRFPNGSSTANLRQALREDGFRIHNTIDRISGAKGYLAIYAWKQGQDCGGYTEVRWRESESGEVERQQVRGSTWCGW